MKRSAERRIAGSIATPRPCSVTSTGRSTAASAVSRAAAAASSETGGGWAPTATTIGSSRHLGDPVAQGEAVDAEAALAGHDHDVVVA